MKTMDEIRALIADIRDPNGRCPTEPLWVALLQKVESVVRERDEARETTRATAKALSIASDGARAEAERADRAESALAALRAAPPDAMREALIAIRDGGPSMGEARRIASRALAPPAALRPPENKEDPRG